MTRLLHLPTPPHSIRTLIHTAPTPARALGRTAILACVVVALVLCVCPAARAGGVGIAWGTVCYSENPVDAVTFACNSNTGPSSWPMTVSFMVDAEMTDFVGVEVQLQGGWTYQAVPDWWKLGPTDCRAGLVSFAADASAIADETCRDWTAGQSFTVFNYTWSGATMLIDAGAAIAADQPYDLPADLEYYACTVTVRNGKTTGDGACSGCAAGVSWSVGRVTAAGLSGRRDDLYDAIPTGNRCLDWNNPFSNDCRWGAAEKSTWGAVKSLYR
jgi:hypothetical protein